MEEKDFLTYKSDIYSQNGEDGIIEAIFQRIGTTTKTCCEFGAWDGIHFSNCRNLILQGWTAIMIEGNEERYKELVANYSGSNLVKCVNKYVDVGSNNLDGILRTQGVNNLDFLSIDIDGLDYEIFKTLDLKPRVICVEVNAGHSPDTEKKIKPEIAKNNIGQPLKLFQKTANKKGYTLICYCGNAFFIRNDVLMKSPLKEISSSKAYIYFLNHHIEKEWLYLVNLGIVVPYYKFFNPYLNRKSLGINFLRATKLILWGIILKYYLFLKHCLKHKKSF